MNASIFTKSLMASALFAATASFASAADITGTFYWANGGNGAYRFDEQGAYKYSANGTGDDLSDIPAGDTINWAESTFVIDAAHTGENVNYLRAPGTSGRELGNVIIKNWGTSEGAGKDPYLWIDDPLNSLPLSIKGNLTFDTTIGWKGSAGGQFGLSVGGNIIITNNSADDSFTTLASLGGFNWQNTTGFRWLTVGGNIEIGSRTQLYSNLRYGAINTSEVGSEANPNAIIGGIVNMDNSGGSSYWEIAFADVAMDSSNVRQQYIKLGGLDGNGTLGFARYSTGYVMSEDVHAAFIFTNKESDKTEFKGNTQMHHGKEHFTVDFIMDGVSNNSQQTLRLDNSYSGLKSTVTSKNGRLLFSSTTSASETQEIDVVLDGGGFGVVAASKPANPNEDFGTLNVESLLVTDKGGNLIVIADKNGNIEYAHSGLIVENTITINGVLNILLEGDNIAEGDILSGIIEWGMAYDQENVAMLNGAFASDMIKLFVNGQEHGFAADSVSLTNLWLSFGVGGMIPEPATVAAIFGAAALALAAYRRRK